MSSELAPTERRFRSAVPRQHRTSLDTRLAWLWNQRTGTVQSVWENSGDPLDEMAATMILQSLFGKDLNSIALLFRRLEGGPLDDATIMEEEEGLTI